MKFRTVLLHVLSWGGLGLMLFALAIADDVNTCSYNSSALSQDCGD